MAFIASRRAEQVRFRRKFAYNSDFLKTGKKVVEPDPVFLFAFYKIKFKKDKNIVHFLLCWRCRIKSPLFLQKQNVGKTFCKFPTYHRIARPMLWPEVHVKGLQFVFHR